MTHQIGDYIKELCRGNLMGVTHTFSFGPGKQPNFVNTIYTMASMEIDPTFHQPVLVFRNEDEPGCQFDITLQSIQDISVSREHKHDFFTVSLTDGTTVNVTMV